MIGIATNNAVEQLCFIHHSGDISYNTGSWAKLTDWEKELAPHYDVAWEMLGAAVNPNLETADLALL